MNQVFEAVLEARFRQCPGHQKVTRKEYALRSNTQNKDIERSVDFRRCFLPGRRVVMSMIFERRLLEASVCPGCNLPSPEREENGESDIEWYDSLAPPLVQILTYCSNGCNLWYQRTLAEAETTKSEAIKATDQAFVSSPARSSKTIENSFHHQRPKFQDEEETPGQFRRVRLTLDFEAFRALMEELERKFGNFGRMVSEGIINDIGSYDVISRSNK